MLICQERCIFLWCTPI